MKILRVYDTSPGEIPKSAVEVVALPFATFAFPTEEGCERCALGKRNTAPIKRPFSYDEKKAGKALLVVLSQTVNANNKTISFLYSTISKIWKGPIYFDFAVRCASVLNDISPTNVDACRAYMQTSIAEIKPTLILAMGANAIYSLLGRSVDTMSVRRGFAFLSTRTPVVMFFDPSLIFSNRFISQVFESDLQWALTHRFELPPYDAEARVIQTVSESKEAADDLRSAVWLSIDAEWSGVPYRKLELLSIACVPRGKSYAYVWDRESLKNAEICAELAKLLEDDCARKVGQNIKSDAHALWCGLGIRLRGVVYDARLMRKILDPEAQTRLKTMAELVGMGGHKEEAEQYLDDAEKNINVCLKVAHATFHGETCKLTKQATPRYDKAMLILDKAVAEDIRSTDDPKSFAFALIPQTVLLRYNAADAIATDRLVDLFETDIADSEENFYVWNRLIRPTIEPIIELEKWGIAVSKDAILSYQEMLILKLTDAHRKLIAHTGPDFNPASSHHVSELLYKKMKLKVPYTTKGGAASTDHEALEELLKVAADGKKEIIESLLEWRHWDKQRNTYAAGKTGCEGMLAHVRGDNRIHTTLHTDGARTGRTSSADPNLQNIPSGEKETYDPSLASMSRNVFVASPGNLMISADYSQLELRVAAMLSGDPEMRAIFDEGVDYHLRTAQMLAELVWGIKPEQVEKSHRKACKAVNFGLLYGQHDKQLAEKIGCDAKMAARIRAAVLGRFKVLAAWIKNCLLNAQKYGGAYTMWEGRRARWRPLSKIGDQADDWARGSAERSSWNTPVQGTASEFCVQSLVRLINWVDEEKLAPDVRVILSVHDSIMLDVREDLVPSTIEKVKQVMQGWETPFNVPLVVDVEVGESWGSLKKIN